MTVNEVIQTFISPVCILILGIYLNKKTAKATEQEDTKEKLWLLTVRGLTACMSLTLQLAEEITAIHGDVAENEQLEESIVYAKKIKNELKDFINSKAVENFK